MVEIDSEIREMMELTDKEIKVLIMTMLRI